MSRKLFLVFSALIAFSLLVAACGTKETETPAGGEVAGPVQTVEVIRQSSSRYLWKALPCPPKYRLLHRLAMVKPCKPSSRCG